MQLALASQEMVIEHWLRTEGVAAHDEMRAHLDRNLPIDEVRAHFAAKLAAAHPPGASE